MWVAASKIRLALRRRRLNDRERVVLRTVEVAMWNNMRSNMRSGVRSSVRSKSVPSIEEGRVVLFDIDARRIRARVEDELDHQGLDVALPGEDQARGNMEQGHLAPLLGEGMVRQH